MESCLYVGNVLHRRFAPKEHSFRYGLYMAYLDLSELPGVFDGHWLWSARRPALHWFRRMDYMDPETPSLDRAVRDRVEAATGVRPQGPIRMLTHLRTLGYVFNPVTFYFVFDPDSGLPAWIVSEITNTPWNERHAYVVAWNDGAQAIFSKQFHVSPFMPMDHEYRWSFCAPGPELSIRMENRREGARVFEAQLELRRTEINRGSLARVPLRYPLMTLRVMTAIHLQALRLWKKRVPFHSHPAKILERQSHERSH